MPDRYGDERVTEPTDPAELRAHREAVRSAHIADCALCDQDGYRGHFVCDHRVHSTPEGRAAAKALLAETLQRKAGEL